MQFDDYFQQAIRGRLWTLDKDVLALSEPEGGRSIAAVIATHAVYYPCPASDRWLRAIQQDLDILRLPAANGETVAGLLARHGSLTRQDKSTLTIRDRDATIAHRLALRGALDPDVCDDAVLALEDERGETVAHWMAAAPNKASRRRYAYAERFFQDKRFLSLKGGYHRPVAHLLVECHPDWYPADREILKLRDDWGNAVAHLLAARGRLREQHRRPDILKMANRDGHTVARILAAKQVLDGLIEAEPDVYMQYTMEDVLDYPEARALEKTLMVEHVLKNASAGPRL